MALRYCIVYGNPIQSDDPQAAMCPDCGGPSPAAEDHTVAAEELPSPSSSSQPVLPGRGASQASSDWQVGDVILDTYEVKGELGQGGFGKVYRVHHKSWNIDLAVKRSLKIEPGSRQAFIEEAEKWVDLGLHPNIVSCYYVRTIDDFPHTFAELAEGGSLEKWIRTGKLYEGQRQDSLKRILDIAIQFAWGLAYAHERGLVHQDVKPDNVLMGAGEVAKVTDFGLARARSGGGVAGALGMGSDASVSAVGGTVAYMSPEQSARQRLTLKTDLWSWGVSVLEMLLGECTWMSGVAALDVLEDYASPGSELAADAKIVSPPGQLVDLLRQCFSYEPVQRPADMLEIAGRLQRIYHVETGQAYPRQMPKAAELRADSLNNMALSKLDMTNHQEAEKLWQDALKIDPHHGEATYNYGMWLWKLGKKSDLDLVNQLHEVIMDQLDNWKPIYLLGLVHLRRRDIPQAKKTLNEALRLSPNNNLVKSELDNLDFTIPMESLGYIHSKGTLHAVFSGHKYDAGVNVYPENYLQVWDLDHNKYTQKFLGHSDKIQCAAFSSDGSKVVSYSKDGTICTWAFDGEVKSLRTLKIDPKNFDHIDISPDETLILLGISRDIYLVDISTGSIRKYSSHSSKIFNILRFSPSGDYFLAGSDDGLFHIFPIQKPGHEIVLEGHTGPIKSLAISHSGRLAITGSTDKSIRIWDLESKKCIKVLEEHTGGVTALAFSGDDKLLASGSTDKTVRLWDRESGQCLRTFEGHQQSIDHVIFRDDDKYIISGCGSIGFQSGSEVVYWKFEVPELPEINWIICRPSDSIENVNTTNLINSKRGDLDTAIKAGALHQAAGILNEIITTPGYENDPELLDLLHTLGRQIGCSCGIRMVNFAESKSHDGGYPRKISFSPDGRMIAIPNLYGIDLRDGNTLEVIRLIHIFSGLQTCCVFTQDGEGIISGDLDGNLTFINFKTGNRLSLEGHKNEVLSIVMAPDGQTLLSSSRDGTLRLWHLDSGKCIRTFTGDSQFIESCAIAPDGSMAISGGLKLQTWNLKTGKEITSGHRYADHLAFSPDGTKIIASEKDEIEVINLKKGYREFHGRGHKGAIGSLAVSANGRFIFSGSHDHTIRIWDIHNQECLRYLEGHEHPVISIALSPDMRRLITCDPVSVRLWAINWEYEFPNYTDWDEGAKPFLENFLTLHTPFAGQLPTDKTPTVIEIRRSLNRVGNPVWTELDFEKLLSVLSLSGYGWLKPEGVRRELERMAKERS